MFWLIEVNNHDAHRYVSHTSDGNRCHLHPQFGPPAVSMGAWNIYFSFIFHLISLPVDEIPWRKQLGCRGVERFVHHLCPTNVTHIFCCYFGSLDSKVSLTAECQQQVNIENVGVTPFNLINMPMTNVKVKKSGWVVYACLGYLNWLLVKIFDLYIIFCLCFVLEKLTQ